ncbi:MAG: type II toxin-antitoxin system VapC family toxin, partial [Defluviitaleaceae bacterium]|nr:type II toxin-antitoxin system VapC family toxin [Defluviitaleaceae bacterium]
MGAINYLLDTHTFLWVAHDDAKLSDTAKVTIKGSNAKNIYISTVSAYEIMNKYRVGKLPEYAYVAENYSNIISEFGAEELPIYMRHAHFAGNLNGRTKILLTGYWRHKLPKIIWY